MKHNIRSQLLLPTGMLHHRSSRSVRNKQDLRRDLIKKKRITVACRNHRKEILIPIDRGHTIAFRQMHM